MPEVLMKHAGYCLSEGVMQGHPAAELVVRGLLEAPDRLAVSLWYGGKFFVGSGVLIKNDRTWTGTVTEYGCPWQVVGLPGTGKLEFSDGEIVHGVPEQPAGEGEGPKPGGGDPPRRRVARAKTVPEPDPQAGSGRLL